MLGQDSTPLSSNRRALSAQESTFTHAALCYAQGCMWALSTGCKCRVDPEVALAAQFLTCRVLKVRYRLLRC